MTQNTKFQFRSKLIEVNSWQIIQLPDFVSEKLNSRGMNMASITILNYQFDAALEPDGLGGHWFKIENNLFKTGENLKIEISPLNDWPEPEIPNDLQSTLNTSTLAKETWLQITTKARWDWIRWIRSTKNPITRNKRLQILISKLESNDRRPCCFNRNICTETQVCQNGKLGGRVINKYKNL